jgi:hypothetical protein
MKKSMTGISELDIAVLSCIVELCVSVQYISLSLKTTERRRILEEGGIDGNQSGIAGIAKKVSEGCRDASSSYRIG